MVVSHFQGLRKAVIIGMTINCIGTWIKVGAVDKDRFYVAFVGQTIVGFAQIFILAVPARLAALWFGPSQVSSACSIGVFGNQVKNKEKLPICRVRFQ